MKNFRKDPPKNLLDQLQLLHESKKLTALIEKTKSLIVSYPESNTLYNIMGMALVALGKTTDAEKSFQKAQILNPTNSDAFNNLGALFQNKQKFDEAISCYKKAIEINNDSFQSYNNIGKALQQQGNFSKAIKYHILAVKINPNYLLGNIDLGLSYYQNEELKQSLKYFKIAEELDTKNPFIHLYIGLIHQREGKLETAKLSYEKALKLKPDFAEAANNIGYIYNAQGKYEIAKLYLLKATHIKADYPEAFNNLGYSLKNILMFDEAIRAFKKAIDLRPEYFNAINNIGNTLREKGNLVQADEFYQQAIKIKPNFSEAYNNMGISLKLQGRFKEAMACYQKALKIKPNYSHALNNLGSLMEAGNKLSSAKNYYQRAINVDPFFADAHYNLSKVKLYSLDDNHFIQLNKLYKKTDLRKEERLQICFALAKAYEDVNRLEESFKFFQEANFIRKAVLNYDISKDVSIFKKVITNSESMPKVPLTSTRNDEIPLPIFIVGMPRSGTTLVEQIISCHNQVSAAGELTFASSLGLPLITGKKSITLSEILDFRKEYLSNLRKYSKGKPFVTDKMPQNFILIDLIFKAMPEAKIIHVTRNPAAVCWSNFKTNFSNKMLGYSNSLDDILEYYGQYENIMATWKQKHGKKIYELNYEKLINDQEKETRGLIKFIGVDWEKNCLSPQNNLRFVQTASNQQIRKKVYSGSSNSWKMFKPFLLGKFDIFSSSENPSSTFG